MSSRKTSGFVACAVSVFASALWGQSLESAQREFDAGHYAAAAELFEKVGMESTRCDARFYVGLSRYHLGQIQAALIAFQAALQCDPKLTRAELALAETYTVSGNTGEALQAYLRILKRQPGEAAALRGAASLYLKNENNEKALPLLEKLTSSEPEDAQAHVDLGATYAAISQPDRAEEQFRQALRLKSNDAGALTGLGNLYEKQGENDKAITVLLEAIKIAPKAFEPRFVLGSAYNRAGRFGEARPQFEAALQFGGADIGEIYYQLARTYGNLGMYGERRTMLAKFSDLKQKAKIATESQRNSAQFLREAESLISESKLPAALEKLHKAQALQPGNAQILFRLAGVQYDLKEYDPARLSIQQAIQIAPSEWVYHFLLGLIEMDCGHLPQAQSSLEVAARLNPGHPEIAQALDQVRRTLAGTVAK